jgi:antitoxin Phd
MVTEATQKGWPVREAKARFTELLEASLREGPQIVTRRGVEVAALVSLEHWRCLRETARPTLKELLIAEAPRFEIPLPSRRRRRRSLPAPDRFEAGGSPE